MEKRSAMVFWLVGGGGFTCQWKNKKNAPERKIKSESRLAHQFLSSAHSARETKFDEVVNFLNYGC